MFLYTVLYLLLMAILSLLLKATRREGLKIYYAYFSGFVFVVLYILSQVYYSNEISTFFNGPSKVPGEEFQCANPVLGGILLVFFVVSPLILVSQVVFNRLILKVNIFRQQ